MMSVPITDLYKLKPHALWRAFVSENFAFWMSCAYLFFEYIRPQAIWSGFDTYPYWARTFIMLSFAGWLFDSKKQFIWTGITTGIFAFQLLIILSSLTAYWPQVSWKNFTLFFNWVVIFFVLTQTVTTRHRFFILLLIFLIASFKLSFHGARTWALRGFAFADWGLAGPQGFFNNPGELAIQMVVFAPMVFFFTLGIRQFLKRWQVYLLLIMPFTAIFTILGTNTRGSQLALAAQVVAIIAMTKHRIKTIIAVVLVGYIGFQLLPVEQKMRFEDAGKDGTSIQRMLYWEHGWKMIKDHPFLGVGYFNFQPYYDKYHSDDIVLSQVHKAQLPHNIFIQVGTDTGFSGISLFIGLILASFLGTRKLGREAEATGDLFMANMAKGMNIALLGYIIAGQFVTVTYYPYSWMHLVFFTAMSTAWKNEKISVT
jgi:putative inorganic carbon (hco3(-)) transporter